MSDSEGREILHAKPVINEDTVDLAALAVSVPDAFFVSRKAEMGRVKGRSCAEFTVIYIVHVFRGLGCSLIFFRAGIQYSFEI